MFDGQNIFSSLNNILYKYEASFVEREEENIDTVVLSSDYEFIELSGNYVKSTCCLNPGKNCKNYKIKVFYTYKPNKKYYIVQMDDILYVISKVDNLQLRITKKESSVSHFEIAYYTKEKPHIHIWYRHFSLLLWEHVLLDEWSKKTLQLFGKENTKINSQMKKLKTEWFRFDEVFKDKIGLGIRMASNHIFADPPESQKDILPLIRIFGDKPKSRSFKIYPICCHKPWFRMLQDVWIVGVHVCNLQERALVNLNLFLITNKLSISKTVVFNNTYSVENRYMLNEDFSEIQKLDGYDKGHVIGTFQPLCFSGSEISFSIILFFNLSGDTDEYILRYHIGDITASLQDILSSRLKPFNNSVEVSDLLAVIACSNSIEVACTNQFDESIELSKALNYLGFSELQFGGFFQQIDKNSAFMGMILVNLNSTMNSMKIYFRKKQQLALFVASLNSILGSNNTFKEISSEFDKNSFLNCCSALRTELVTFFNIVESNLQNKSDSNEDHRSIKEEKNILFLEFHTQRCFLALTAFSHTIVSMG